MVKQKDSTIKENTVWLDER